ncbi:U32 family peptidase [archaeon]|nr:U32 family peptidase [archaeon]
MTIIKQKKIEIMAPAGSYESLAAAIKAGTNSIYFGVGDLNMRSRSANFELDDLEKVAQICKENNVKSYLTLNTVVYDNELELIKQLCDRAKQTGITAVIASDISVIEYAHSIELEVHISTQANVSNFEAIKFYSKYADVIVLARELKIEQIKEICEKIKSENICGPKNNLIEIEIFVHGALCVSISGKCYMSLAQYNFSANRGACLQACRRSYLVTDEETGDELIVDNKFIMSPKDLCTIKFLDKIIDSGVSVLKIEGRGRSPDYVYTTVKSYREATDACLTYKFNEEKINNWVKQLEEVFNRGFWHGGYYLGNKLGEWCDCYGSKATKQKKQLGTVKNYFSKVNVMEIEIEANEIVKGDEIVVIGPTTGVVKEKVEIIRNSLDNKNIESAEKGMKITIPINEKVRMNDKVYLWVNRN